MVGLGSYTHRDYLDAGGMGFIIFDLAAGDLARLHGLDSAVLESLSTQPHFLAGCVRGRYSG